MNVVYRMASPRDLDALVVLSSTVGNFEEPSRVAQLVRDTGLPAVSIAVELEGLPSVLAPGERAMAELVRHLAREHGRKRFALVTGPRRHPNSAEREAAFRATLAEEGIPFDEALVHEGQFFKESGAEAVRSFLSANLCFDALVCLSDYMALGALEALRGAGKIPGADISLIGFDGVLEAECCSPPMTTVRQPIEEMGRKAVDMALERLEGRSPPSVELDCDLVFGQSCGCPPSPPLSPGYFSPLESRDERTRELEDSIAAMAKREDAQGALGYLDKALNERPGDMEAATQWRRRLYAIRSGRGEKGAASSLGWFDQAQAHLARTEGRWGKERTLAMAERYALIRELGRRLLGTFSIEALAREWRLCLAPMGIPRSYLVLFEGEVERGGRRLPLRSRLVLADDSLSGGLAHFSFETAELLPPELGLDRGDAGWIVEPLVYQDEALGYILIETGSEEAIAYEAMREQLSAAVKASLLMEENQEHRKSLEREVEQRTRELREAHREIQEISNRTMQAIGQDLHDDLCQQLAGISVLAAAVEEKQASTGSVRAADLREIRELLGSAVSRARQVARSLYPPGLEARGLVPALEDLVEAQGRASGSVSISLQAEEDCAIGDPDVALYFYRIIQEALVNALRHSGSEVVVVRLFREGASVVAEVRDFGRGMRDAPEGRGMGLRIMRHRAETIGARLDIRELDPGLCVSCALAAR
jgi:Transcriptional regulators